jgi:uncharacterized protein
MQNSEKAADPSMEEILASIRKIISEEPDGPASSPEGRATPKAAPAPPPRPDLPIASAPSRAVEDDDDLSDILDQSTQRVKPFGRRQATEDSPRASPPKLEAIPMSGPPQRQTDSAASVQTDSPFGMPLPRTSHAPATPPLPKSDAPSSASDDLAAPEVRKPATDDDAQTETAGSAETSGADQKGDGAGFTLADRLRGFGRSRPDKSDTPAITNRVVEPTPSPAFEAPPAPDFPSLTKLKADIQADAETPGEQRLGSPRNQAPPASAGTSFGERPEPVRQYETKVRDGAPATTVTPVEVAPNAAEPSPPYSDANLGDRWEADVAATSAGTSFGNHTRHRERVEIADEPIVARFSRDEVEAAPGYASADNRLPVEEPELRQSASDDFEDLWLDEPSDESPEVSASDENRGNEWSGSYSTVPKHAPTETPASAAAGPLAILAASSAASSDTSTAGSEAAPAVRTLEDTVSELLRPLLREWLDANMPRIVEKALRVELAARGLRNSEKDSSQAG